MKTLMIKYGIYIVGAFFFILGKEIMFLVHQVGRFTF